jgi:hypothetical protein
VLDVLEPDDFDLVDLRSMDHAIEYDTGNPSDGLSGPGFELADDLIATA